MSRQTDPPVTVRLALYSMTCPVLCLVVTVFTLSQRVTGIIARFEGKTAI